jgi:hypothetical protein
MDISIAIATACSGYNTNSCFVSNTGTDSGIASSNTIPSTGTGSSNVCDTD